MPWQRCAVVLRRRLGRRLRWMREQAGLTLVQAAPRLEKSVSSLQRIEAGETRADTHVVRSMMDLYGVWDESLLDLARQAARPVWWRHYDLPNDEYVGLEAEACTISAFGAVSIPDLLQTDAYSAALAQCRVRSRAAVRTQHAARAIRWRRLSEPENPLRLQVILDEAALARMVGGPEVMAEQAAHLARAGAQDGVSIQVIPFDTGQHVAMHGSFTVLTFPEPEDPDTLYIEYVTGARPIERRDEVREAVRCFERLRADAPSPADSLDLIQRPR